MSAKKRPRESDSHHAPYAFYGTRLPPYDPSARDDGSYIPIWKQEVTDERGRKRLHGAFTGGWSAGYFNTVGSKEGWAPGTFVSSRANRAEDGKQRREDFMDEEDLAEQAESQRLETQGAFAGLGGTGEDTSNAGKGMFADLFRSNGETIGVKLLQRMGWRQGQGVGRRVWRRVKGDEKGEKRLFAPENSRMIGFVRKTDRKGVGFAGEERLDGKAKQDENEHEASDQDARTLHLNHRSRLQTKAKKVKKTGLGVGVLNDTGSDDENEYDLGPKINYTRVLGEKTKRKAKDSVPTFTSKKLTQRTSTLPGFRKCHDGRLPLDGFVLTISPLSTIHENAYPPPTIPAGWSSVKSSRNVQHANQTPSSFVSTADAAKASTLDPNSRAKILGEQQLPGKSVFDFLTPSARERLVSATGNERLPPALGERNGAPDPVRSTSTSEQVKTKPHSSEVENSRPAIPASAFSGSMGLGSRFTTSSPSSTAAAKEEAMETHTNPHKASEQAAKVGMYGPLTRSRQPFYPTRLLCKRFNVPVPASGSGDVDEGMKRLDVVGAGNLDRFMREAAFVSAGVQSGEQKEGVLLDVERNEALERPRAGDEAFRDVFGEDVEEE